MSRRFVSSFLLPLVRGGIVKVGRPWTLEEVRHLAEDRGARESDEQSAASALADERRRALIPLVPTPPVCALDLSTLRLGAAAHDLLLLAHPRIAGGSGAQSRIERVAAAAAALAALGPPGSASETLARHSVIARLPEAIRQDHTVRFWLGQRSFIGRRPPPRVLALPHLRGVRVETVKRTWLRDVGIEGAARPAFAALSEASPLGEALAPMRLDPPPSWGRLLSVLKFPVIGRLVAGKLVEAGVGPAGDALTEALYRFGASQDTAGPVPVSGASVAFVVAFLAHTVWLDHVFGARGGELGPSSGAARPPAEGSGRELAVLLAAAADVDPSLMWPPDVPHDAELGRQFTAHIARWFTRHEVKRSARWATARELAAFAASSRSN